MWCLISNKKSYLIIGLSILLFGSVLAQFPIKIPKPWEKISPTKLLEKEQPVTSSIEDAVTEVPFLDTFIPLPMKSLSRLSRGPNGGFLIENPGAYMLYSKSYCLKAGAHGPGPNDGYLYVPLKGSAADVIRNVMRRSINYPQISQEDIQGIVWAITSRAKISELSPEWLSVARKLLSPEEISRLDSNSLGDISRDVLQQAISELPPQAQKVFEIESKVRELLSQPGTSFQEIERIAILPGTPPLTERIREFPVGRWSYHPDGYFISYLPRDYSKFLIRLYFPEPFQIETDSSGRIKSIALTGGNRIEAEYDDTISQLKVPNESDLKGYSFKSIRYMVVPPKNMKIQFPVNMITSAEWKNPGWTFVGMVNGKGRPGTVSQYYSGAEVRYEWAKRYQGELKKLVEGVKKIQKGKATIDISREEMEKLVNLGHLTSAMQAMINSGDASREELHPAEIELCQRAWQSEFAKSITHEYIKEKTVILKHPIFRLYSSIHPAHMFMLSEIGSVINNAREFDPTGAAVSGNKGLQPGEYSSDAAKDACFDYLDSCEDEAGKKSEKCMNDLCPSVESRNDCEKKCEESYKGSKVPPIVSCERQCTKKYNESLDLCYKVCKERYSKDKDKCWREFMKCRGK